MQTREHTHWRAALLVAAVLTAWPMGAAEAEARPGEIKPRREREERQDKTRNNKPEEGNHWRDHREAKAQDTPRGTNTLEALREELKKLSPEQREARIKRLREERPDLASQWDRDKRRREENNRLPPRERELKKKEWRSRMEGVVEKYRTKKANGTLTSEEARNLERMEEMLKRLEHQQTVPPAVPTTGNPSQ